MCAEGRVCGVAAVGRFIAAEQGTDVGSHHLRVTALDIGHAQLQHRMPRPTALQMPDGKPLEKVVATSEVVFHRRAQHRLAESPRTAQKDGVAIVVGQVIDVVGLVDIDKPLLYDGLKILHAGRVSSPRLHVTHLNDAAILFQVTLPVSLGEKLLP